MIKVLVVSQYFWPESFYVNEVVTSLINNGVQVDVLTGKPNYPGGKVFRGYTAAGLQNETWCECNIFRIPLFPRGQRVAWRLTLNYLTFIVSGLIFGPWLLRRRRYHIVLVYGVSPILQAIPALLIGRIKGCKTVLWIQDLWPESLRATGYINNQFVLNIVRILVSWIYRSSDLLLVQSKAFIYHVKQLAGKTPVFYQPNSVNAIFTLSASENKKQPQIDSLDKSFSIIFAGNIGSAQAVEVIVEVATRLAHHPEIQFVVIGQGSRWEWMNEQVKARGLQNLHLLGHFPMSTMPGLLKKASALLVTLNDDPIFALTVPNKIQAYLAVGRPILACLNGEGARVVEEARAGIAVPAGDVDSLVNAVLKLYGMTPEERSEMGLSGYQYFIENFEHEKLIQHMLKHLMATAAGEYLV